MMWIPVSTRRLYKVPFFTLLLVSSLSFGQSNVPLNDLSFFESGGTSWKIGSNVTADLGKKNFLALEKGVGVLANIIDKKNKGADLYSKQQYSDMDLELDYMMASGSNSGIYLQGRYEIQLLDSWAASALKSGDNGGIYERWDESKPDGQKGYEGYAPRQNVSRAPGLWQHLKISFQAPRFDAAGKKTENAKMLRVELNGVLIHEDIELFGPTRGAAGAEAPTGPLRIQGDHGSVAFKNIKLTNFDKPRPSLSAWNYKIYNGRFTKEDQLSTAAASREGSSEILTSDVNSIENEFGILFEGTINITEPGEYNFTLRAPGGVGQLTIGSQTVVAPREWGGEGTASLSPGAMPIRIFYSKYVDWAQPLLALKISGPGIREYSLNEAAASFGRAADPIFVQAPANTLLRSFIDLPDKIRVVHAVSVGTPEKIHYTYDMDNGTVVQVWRGEFLDATPMWHERGDGSSRPRGSIIRFGKPTPTIEKLTSPSVTWSPDTTGTRFRTKGYQLNANDQPTFIYQISGATIHDAITLANGNQGISRTLTIKNANGNFYVRLAQASTIEEVSENLYAIDNKAYYLRLEDKNLKPVIRESNGVKEMLMPIQSKVSYSIIF